MKSIITTITKTGFNSLRAYFSNAVTIIINNCMCNNACCCYRAVAANL
ncbi:hypothetical protein [Ohtaekwangia koreensis]|nr:hypothetical protein [Ohtaekwangia koreensis]